MVSESVYCGCLEQPYNHNDWRYNQIKEELCFTYLSTICAFLGATLERKTRPMDNAVVDATTERNKKESTSHRRSIEGDIGPQV